MVIGVGNGQRKADEIIRSCRVLGGVGREGQGVLKE